MKNKILWTALITPMNSDGSVNFQDLEKLVKRQDEAGNGILLIGSTGEGLALTDSEKYDIVKFVSELSLDAPIMVGVGGFNFDSQKKWIESCNSLNVDAFLLVAPLYSKPGPEGQIEWFTGLMNTAEKPCMLYNIPSRSGVKIPISVLKKLEGHKQLWAVKEASGSIDDFQAYREACPDIPLYSGDDGLMPFFSRVGCRGLVSVASNVWPEATHLYTQKCIDGETDTLFPVWSEAVRALFSASNPIPAKILMQKKGDIETDTLRLPLTTHEMSDVSALQSADEKIIDWYKLINR